VETSRQAILDILRRRQATVDGLAKALDLAPATVRRHLDILMRDGYVNVSQVRRETGRPHYLFSLSEAGEDLFPKHYMRITNRLIEEVVALTPEDTADRAGPDLAKVVFEKMAQHMAQRIGPRIHGGTFHERVQGATRILAEEEGVVFTEQTTADGILLVGRGCPCPRVADTHPEVCTLHQQLLARLLDAEVTPMEVTSTGERAYCAWLAREHTTASSAPDGSA
jgi:predicted ArsR family transcriptional regulator